MPKIPCSALGSYAMKQQAPDAKTYKKMRAIFQKNNVWGKNGQNMTGLLTVTFGSMKCDGCGPTASWSLIGSDSNGSSPSLNLGFIDPPYSDFTFNGKTYPYKEFKNATRNYCDLDTITVPSTCTDLSDFHCHACEPNWVPGATIVHEFMHSLAAVHEHQNNINNSNPIKLNIQTVKDYYHGIGMSDADATANSIERYMDTTTYEGSEFDPDSIMLYFIPDNWIQGYDKPGFKNPTKPNFTLSTLDKQWLQREYPISANTLPNLTVKFVDTKVPEWKCAWTQKIVLENLAPLVGITWSFINTDGSAVTFKPIENPQFSIGPILGSIPPLLQGVINPVSGTPQPLLVNQSTEVATSTPYYTLGPQIQGQGQGQGQDQGQDQIDNLDQSMTEGFVNNKSSFILSIVLLVLIVILILYFLY